MCLIIDADLAHEFDSNNLTALSRAVLKKLVAGEVKIATGGRNFLELKNTPMGEVLITLSDAGQVMRYRDAAIEKEAALLLANGVCASNDHHVLALAIISGAHIVYSRDGKLGSDFRNAKIVPLRQGCPKRVLNSARQAADARQMNCCKCQPV